MFIKMLFNETQGNSRLKVMKHNLLYNLRRYL